LPNDDILAADRRSRIGQQTHLREHSQLKTLSKMREGDPP